MDWIVQTRAADGPWVRGMGTPRSDGPHEPYHCRAGGPDKRERRGLLVATHRNEILVPNRNASIAFGSCTAESVASGSALRQKLIHRRAPTPREVRCERNSIRFFPWADKHGLKHIPVRLLIFAGGSATPKLASERRLRVNLSRWA
jgi:hypothetical protein